MSGPICPDCGIGNITTKGEKDICDFCGWKGPRLPRKIRSSDMYRKMAEDSNRRHKLRKEGTLHFVRVYVKDSDAVDTFTIMDILDIHSLGGAGGEPPYYYIELEGDLDTEKIKKVKALKGVVKVKVT